MVRVTFFMSALLLSTVWALLVGASGPAVFFAALGIVLGVIHPETRPVVVELSRSAARRAWERSRRYAARSLWGGERRADS